MLTLILLPAWGMEQPRCPRDVRCPGMRRRHDGVPAARRTGSPRPDRAARPHRARLCRVTTPERSAARPGRARRACSADRRNCAPRPAGGALRPLGRGRPARAAAALPCVAPVFTVVFIPPSCALASRGGASRPARPLRWPLPTPPIARGRRKSRFRHRPRFTDPRCGAPSRLPRCSSGFTPSSRRPGWDIRQPPSRSSPARADTHCRSSRSWSCPATATTCATAAARGTPGWCAQSGSDGGRARRSSPIIASSPSQTPSRICCMSAGRASAARRRGSSTTG